MIGFKKFLLPHYSINLSIKYYMPYLADSSSKAKHPPTTDMWEYGDGKTP